MKLRKSQRIMSLFLSLLMLLSTFAGSGFTVRAAEPTEVEAGDLDETSAAPEEVTGDEIEAVSTTPVEVDPDALDPDLAATPRSFTIAATDGGNTAVATNGNIVGVYGVALAGQTSGNATYTVTPGGSYTITNYTATVYKLKEGKTTGDISGTSVEANLSALEEVDLKTTLNLDLSKEGNVITISGTPKKVISSTQYYLGVVDATGVVTASDGTEYSNAASVLTNFTITVTESAPSLAYNIAARESSKTLTFGSDAGDSAPISDSAGFGYTVESAKPIGSEVDNVKPIVITLTNTGLNAEDGAKVNAKIVAFDEVSNTDATVTSGAESVAAFSVDPAVSTENLGNLKPVKFTVKPATGLEAKAAAGTTYKAKLEITSDEFNKITYTLVFKVTNGVAISEVSDKNGAAVTANSFKTSTPADIPAYDLGTFKVGETIDAVTIKAAGGPDTISFDEDFTGSITCSTQSSDTTWATDTYTYQALPAGLSVDKRASGVYKISGMITTAASAYVDDNYHYFALTAKDGNGVSGAKTVFRYKVASADVKIYMVKGDYSANSETAEEITAGDTSATFNWFGAASTLTDDFVTVYIENKSGVALDITEVIDDGTTNAGTMSLDASSAKTTSSIIIAAGTSGSFKIYPKTLQNPGTDNTAEKAIKLTAAGLAATTIEAKYEKIAALTITRPETGVTELGTAYLGRNFSYTFAATNPNSANAVKWEITSLTVHTAANTTQAYTSQTDITKQLADFGLKFEDGKISGVLKKLDGDSNTTKRELLINVRINGGTNEGTNLRSGLKILTAPTADGLALSSDGKELSSSKKLSLPDVSINNTGSGKATVTITNNTLVELSGIKVASGNTKFSVTYDENNATLNADLVTNGFSIAPGGTASFVVKPVAVQIATVGTHTETIVLESDDIKADTFKFDVSMKVTGEPVINTTNITGIKVDTEYTEASNKLLTTDYSSYDDNGGTFAYSMSPATIAGGLTLSETGYLVGKANQVGSYTVTITSTTKDLDTNVSGSKTFNITVGESSTINVVTATGGTSVADRSYILEGEATGYTAGDKLKLMISAATEDAENLSITIADAKDDRSVEEDLDGNGVADVLESTANPYAGSVNYIGVSTTSISKIEKTTGANLNIVSKAGAPAGVYKATVTITGRNTNSLSFDVVMVVVDKLTFSVPTGGFAGKIGTALTDTSLVLSAEGGYVGQTITWKEEGTLVDGATKYYITTSGAADSRSTETALTLTDEADVIGEESGLGLKTNVLGTPSAASGSTPFTVNVSAKANGITYADLILLSDDLTLPVRTAVQRTRDGLSVAGNTNKVIPDIDALNGTSKTASFTITIAKSDAMKVTDVTEYGGAKASLGNLAGTVVGTSVGSSYSNIESYTWGDVVYGYTAANEAVTFTVTGGASSLGNVTAKLGKGENSSFRIAVGETAAKQTSAASVTWKILPKTDLDTGTYTDTLSFSGDNVSEFSVALSMTVSNPSYLATIDNNIKATDANASKRVEYIADAGEGTGTVKLELDTITKGSGTAGSDKVIAIRNSGNSALSNVQVREVKKSGSSFVNNKELLNITAGESAEVGVKVQLTATSDVTDSASIPVGQYGTFKVRNAASTSAGEKEAYLEISFSDGGSGKKYIYIPVSFVVLNDKVENISVTPPTSGGSTANVSLPNAKEGYTADSTKVDFVVKNGASGAAETLKTLSATLDGADKTSFELILPSSLDVKAGESATVTVRPKEGLPAGTYNANVTFGGDNINSEIVRYISFTVAESTEYTFNRITTTAKDGTDSMGASINADIAEKLYNTLVLGYKGVNDADNIGSITGVAAVGTKKQKVTLSLDSTGTNDDIEIEFAGEGTDSKYIMTSVTGATIALKSGFSLTSSSYSISLTEAQGKAAAGAKALGDKKYFSKLIFKPYATVTYGVSNTTIYEQKKVDLDNDYVSVETTVNDGSDEKDNAKGLITTYVALGKNLGTAFAGSTYKDLPTAKAAGTVFLNWQVNGATPARNVTKTTAATGNLTLVVKESTIEYSAGSDKTEDTGVKWTWTYDAASGSIDAVLTLSDVNGKAGSDSDIVIKKDSTVVAAASAVKNDIATKVTIADHGSVAATCTQGSRKEFLATAEIWANSHSGATPATTKATFTSTYSLDEQNDAKGHTWGTATVDWDNPNADGTYNVSYVCTECGERVVVKASASDSVTREATCTTPGTKTTTLSWRIPDTKTLAPTTVSETATKDLVIDAKGHSYSLSITWNDDHKTAKTAELVCSVCDAGETGHSVNVLSSVKYVTSENADGTIASNKASVTYEEKEYTVTWVDHTEHKWVLSSFVWSGLTGAAATWTCSEGGETEAATVVMSSETRGDGDEAITAYTATVSVDPDGTSIKPVSETKYRKADGSEATKKDFEKVSGTVVISEGSQIAIVGLIGEYDYTGAAIQPAFNVIDEARDVVLAKGVDYTVKFKNNKAVGTASVTITGKGNYAGANTTATFKIVDVYAELTADEKSGLADLAGAKIGAIAAAGYTGEAIEPDITLTLKGGSPVTYIAESGYTASNGDSLYDIAVLTISNNVNKGTATVLLQGKPNAKGKITSVKKTFKINAVDISSALTNNDFDVEIASEAEYRVKGATPAVSLSYKGIDLVEGQDYTVKSNGKKVGGAVVTITGKNNFTKKFTQSFSVTPLSLDNCRFVAASAFDGAKVSAIKATILDPNGDALKVKTHYTLKVEESGTELGAKTVVKAGQDLTITALANGDNIEKDTDADLNVTVGYNLAKAKIVVTKGYTKTYTGSPVVFENDDDISKAITVTIKTADKSTKTLKSGEDFEVTGYTNNLKKGTMTVTINGTGKETDNGTFSGTKTFKIKIVAKSIAK